MIVGILIGFIIGMLVGRFFREPKPSCPAEVLGYSCKRDTGRECDHRESLVYEAQMNMAKWREDREADNNYFGGN